MNTPREVRCVYGTQTGDLLGYSPKKQPPWPLGREYCLHLSVPEIEQEIGVCFVDGVDEGDERPHGPEQMVDKDAGPLQPKVLFLHVLPCDLVGHMPVWVFMRACIYVLDRFPCLQISANA